MFFIFGFVVMYLFAAFGFAFVDSTYWDWDMTQNINQKNLMRPWNQGERTCSNLFWCFMTTVNFGIRNGGGLADTLKP